MTKVRAHFDLELNCDSDYEKICWMPLPCRPTVEVCFIDIDWGGSTIATSPPRYPFHLNLDIRWPLDNPSRKLILQEHDTKMLQTTLTKFWQRRAG